MGYKIFFAYQSDSDDKFNKGFIHQASLNAISKLKTEGYNIEFDYGFKKTPGTPILIKEMLKKNDEADMVLVDLTLTSTSKGFNSKTLNILGNTISFHKDRKDKFSPNPNVLLETGYAWSSKGHYRTLAIMNTSYGSPINLPVDFNGFRWAITYSLNNENYKERKSVRKGLVEDLYQAFKSSLNSEASYQIEKWKPFIIGNQWKKHHSYPYKITLSLKTKINYFRELLNSRRHIRITGLKGCGKTRFVLEALNQHKENDYNSLTEQIIYHDYRGATAGDISKQISELENLNQHKIFIGDNCSFEEYKKLRKRFKGTNVKIITISSVKNTQETDNANIFIEERITIEVFEEIIKEKFGAEKVSEITDHFELNLEEFIDRILDGIGKENIDISNIEYLKLLLGEYWIEKGALKFLFALAFFKQIGVTGIYKKEINFIREVFIDCSEHEVIKLKEFLELKRFIKPKGNFITLNRYEDELKEYGIEQSIDNIEAVVIGVGKNNLWPRFKQTFLKILKQHPQLIENLNNDEGLLNQHDFINSEKGGLFLNLLADEYPEIALDKLTKKVESNDRGI